MSLSFPRGEVRAEDWLAVIFVVNYLPAQPAQPAHPATQSLLSSDFTSFSSHTDTGRDRERQRDLSVTHRGTSTGASCSIIDKVELSFSLSQTSRDVYR